VFEAGQRYVEIDIIFCTGKAGDHPECATTEATIQFTRSSVTISIIHDMLFENIVFRGKFSLVQCCTKAACTYCSAVHINLTTGLMNDDRNKVINLGGYADQSLCEFFKNTALIRMRPKNSLIMTNITYVDVKHQLQALILNECGDLRMNNVTFSDVISRRSGLQAELLLRFQAHYTTNTTVDPLVSRIVWWSWSITGLSTPRRLILASFCG
jgi:hypothetical protein